MIVASQMRTGRSTFQRPRRQRQYDTHNDHTEHSAAEGALPERGPAAEHKAKRSMRGPTAVIRFGRCDERGWTISSKHRF